MMGKTPITLYFSKSRYSMGLTVIKKIRNLDPQPKVFIQQLDFLGDASSKTI